MLFPFFALLLPEGIAANNWWSCVYQCSPGGWNALNAGVCRFGQAPCPAPNSNEVTSRINGICWGSPGGGAPVNAEQLPWPSKNACDSYTATAQDFSMASRQADWNWFLNNHVYSRRLKEDIDEQDAPSTAVALVNPDRPLAPARRRLFWGSIRSWMQNNPVVTQMAITALGAVAGLGCGAVTGGTLAAACGIGVQTVFAGLGAAASGRRLALAHQATPLLPYHSCSVNETVIRDEIMARIAIEEEVEVIHHGYPDESRDDYAVILHQQQIEDAAKISAQVTVLQDEIVRTNFIIVIVFGSVIILINIALAYVVCKQRRAGTRADLHSSKLAQILDVNQDPKEITVVDGAL